MDLSDTYFNLSFNNSLHARKFDMCLNPDAFHVYIDIYMFLDLIPNRVVDFSHMYFIDTSVRDCAIDNDAHHVRIRVFDTRLNFVNTQVTLREHCINTPLT